MQWKDVGKKELLFLFTGITCGSFAALWVTLWNPFITLALMGISAMVSVYFTSEVQRANYD